MSAAPAAAAVVPSRILVTNFNNSPIASFKNRVKDVVDDARDHVSDLLSSLHTCGHELVAHFRYGGGRVAVTEKSFNNIHIHIVACLFYISISTNLVKSAILRLFVSFTVQN